MIKAIFGGAAALTVVLASTALADNHEEEGPVVAPVEVYVCNFNEGKGMADFDAWLKRWNKFMDKNDQSGYEAIALLPSYSSSFEFDIGWVGYTSSGESLGQALDVWRDKGSELNAAVFEIMSCAARTNFASMSVKKGADGPMPPNPVASFSDCTIKEGTDFESAIDSVVAWNEFRAEGGQAGPAWVWFPAYGESTDATYHFKYVEGFRDYADWGADWDLYGNGGGWQKARELFADKLDCDSGRVYEVKALRIGDDG